MSARNKELIRRWYEEIINRHDLDAAAEVLDPDFVSHAGFGSGIEEFKKNEGAIFRAFPDLRVPVGRDRVRVGPGGHGRAGLELRRRHPVGRNEPECEVEGKKRPRDLRDHLAVLSSRVRLCREPFRDLRAGPSPARCDRNVRRERHGGVAAG